MENHRKKYEFFFVIFREVYKETFETLFLEFIGIIGNFL